MSITLIGSNLNIVGNNGNFETDPSTWGEVTSQSANNARSLAQASKGIASFLVTEFTADEGGKDPNFWLYGTSVCSARATFDATKKYSIRAKVRVPSSNPIVNRGSFKIGFDDLNRSITLLLNSETTKTLATDSWVFIEARLSIASNMFLAGTNDINLVINPTSPGSSPTDQDNLLEGGQIYIDEFEIYEYVDDVVPCTLSIDISGTSIVNATTSSSTDGQISIAITGGISPFFYSKDNGATWQSSPVFSGLLYGIYQCKAKDLNGCESAQAFSVNYGSAAFDFTASVSNETISGASDGSIAITPSGSGAPFTYSKDAGATYQSGNIFTGLAPGVYTIAVKDASAYVIAHLVTVLSGEGLFDDVFFSRNMIYFPDAAPVGFESTTNYRRYCDTRVEDNAGSGIFNTKLQSALVPAADGSVNFALRQAFRGVLSAIAPSLNESAIKRLTDRIKYFRNYTGDLHDDIIVPVSLSASNPFLVLLGGVNKLNYPTIDFFKTYMPANKKFMTWAPLKKQVDSAQEDYLNFWIYSNSISQITLKLKAYFDDGTNTTVTVTSQNGVVFGELYQIPAGPANTGALLVDGTKNLLKYDLWLINQSSVVISEVRTYVIDPVSYPKKRFFMILNSLGAYEVHRFYGYGSLEVNLVNQTISQKFLQPDYNSLDGEFEEENNATQNKNSFSTGFFDDDQADAWLEYITELLLARKFFNVTDGSRVPMIKTSKSILGKDDQTYKRFVQFSAVDAYIDENFTPKSI